MSAYPHPSPSALAERAPIAFPPSGYPLFGRQKLLADPGPLAEAHRREQLSAALLALYAPCAPEAFPQRAMEITRGIVPADLISFEDLDLHSGDGTTHLLGQPPGGVDDFQKQWRHFAREHPIIRAHLRGGSDEACTYSLEDLLPEAQRASLAIERKFFQPFGLRQQLAVFFGGSDTATGVFLSRAGCFAASEQRLLRFLAPHLAQAHRHHLLLASPENRPTAYRQLAWERLRSAGFSRRECEVLHWLAEGKSDDDIAVILGLSRKTVSNQVLELTHKLQAHNRIGAVTSALQIIEMPPPVELESTVHDREAQFQAHLVKLAGAPTPALVLQHLRQFLAALWPGLGAEAWLVRLDDEDNRFAPLAPARVKSYAERMALHAAPVVEGTPPILAAPHHTLGAVRHLPLPPSAYVWENRAAPAGELLTALVLVPERLAFAIVLGADVRSLGPQRLAEWHRLAPHVLLACRGAHRLVARGCGPLVPAPPPGSSLWQRLANLHLTERQIETMAWVADGASDQQIAGHLGVSIRTVHAHLRAIFELLGVENRLAAVLAACRHFTQALAYEGD